MTVLAPPAPPQTQSPVPWGRVLLHGISWAVYQKLRDDLGDSPVHLTYDDGLLEIEVPSKRHEELKALANELVIALLQTARIDYLALGSTTWNREQPLKGIEADECYYVQTLPAVAEKENISLGVDPPPDLAIEVEVTSSALDKLRVYGALGVPEVWRIREDASLQMLRRNPAGGYEPVAESTLVPRATVSRIEAQLKRMRPVGPLIQSTVAREFRESLTMPKPAE
jgi:Uma2 family endonuclease